MKPEISLETDHTSSWYWLTSHIRNHVRDSEKPKEFLWTAVSDFELGLVADGDLDWPYTKKYASNIGRLSDLAYRDILLKKYHEYEQHKLSQEDLEPELSEWNRDAALGKPLVLLSIILKQVGAYLIEYHIRRNKGDIGDIIESEDLGLCEKANRIEVRLFRMLNSIDSHYGSTCKQLYIDKMDGLTCVEDFS